ncbi:hypothetical protein SAMN04488109_1804 [Chryseolinea serpens]|uniref:Uncharacterized protein n=1 Tax=Chryseolinea serpens TaxID=947013 RepID=A0A1M5MLD0_9BACT|nr:hypothetical protein SAMN04488109_1804 [Chryseolinea serpens]
MIKVRTRSKNCYLSSSFVALNMSKEPTLIHSVDREPLSALSSFTELKMLRQIGLMRGGESDSFTSWLGTIS